MDVRNRRLDTAKIVMQCLVDAKKENNQENYEGYLWQLETMKKEFGIHYRLDRPTVFYPQCRLIEVTKHIFGKLESRFRSYFKS